MSFFFRRFIMPRTAPVLVFLPLFVAMFLFPCSSARAQDIPDAYLVKDVQVDVVDQSAVKARDKAFLKAETGAFTILAQRFLGEKEGAVTKAPSPKVLSGLVQDFEIVSEQLSKKRYRGTYNFRFRPAAVRGYFGHGPDNYVPEEDAVHKAVLLIPFFQKNGTTVIWEKERNPFWAALLIKNKEAGSVLMPLGDIADMTDVGESAPQSISTVSLKRLKGRYDVSGVVVAVAKVDATTPHSLVVDLYQTDRGESRKFDSFTLEETVPPQSGDENVFIQASLRVLSTLNGDWKKSSDASSYQNTQPADNVPVVVPETKETMPSVLANDTKNIKPVSDNVLQASVKVFFTGMSQWLEMRRQLAGVAAIEAFDITSLKTNQVDMTLSYRDWNSLSAGLAAKGFVLESAGSNNFVLKRVSGSY